MGSRDLCEEFGLREEKEIRMDTDTDIGKFVSARKEIK